MDENHVFDNIILRDVHIQFGPFKFFSQFGDNQFSDRVTNRVANCLTT